MSQTQKVDQDLASPVLVCYIAVSFGQYGGDWERAATVPLALRGVVKRGKFGAHPLGKLRGMVADLRVKVYEFRRLSETRHATFNERDCYLTSEGRMAWPHDVDRIELTPDQILDQII